jgi:hypothetical protein
LLVSKSGVITLLLRSIINASLIAKACNGGGLEVRKAISPHCPGSFEQGKFTLFLRIAAESKLTTGERQIEQCSRETALTSASLQMKNEFTSVAQYAVGQVSIMR